MKIGKNRKELIHRILTNAKDIRYYHDDDMFSEQGKFEDQEKGKAILQDELTKWDFAYLSCDNKGSCHVHVTSNNFYSFDVDPTIIQSELNRNEEKQAKRQEKSQERLSQLRELGFSSLPKQFKSVDDLKTRLEEVKRQKSLQSATPLPISKSVPTIPVVKSDPTIDLTIQGTCDEFHEFTYKNLVWDKPFEPSADSFGNRLVRKINKTLIIKCPNKEYTKELVKSGIQRHIKLSD